MSCCGARLDPAAPAAGPCQYSKSCSCRTSWSCSAPQRLCALRNSWPVAAQPQPQIPRPAKRRCASLNLLRSAVQRSRELPASRSLRWRLLAPSCRRLLRQPRALLGVSTPKPVLGLSTSLTWSAALTPLPSRARMCLPPQSMYPSKGSNRAASGTRRRDPVPQFVNLNNGSAAASRQISDAIRTDLSAGSSTWCIGGRGCSCIFASLSVRDGALGEQRAGGCGENRADDSVRPFRTRRRSTTARSTQLQRRQLGHRSSRGALLPSVTRK